MIEHDISQATCAILHTEGPTLTALPQCVGYVRFVIQDIRCEKFYTMHQNHSESIYIYI